MSNINNIEVVDATIVEPINFKIMNSQTQTQTQSALFIDELKEVLADARVTTKEAVDDSLDSAKANINTFITDSELDEVGRIAEDNDLSYLVKRSGAGLVIEFKRR